MFSKDDYQSVIHEGSKCSLYNTALVTGQKKPEQNVLAMNKTAMINHLEVCAKMKPCDRNKVLLRRQDGSVKFTDKLWNDYKKGFGDFQTEFWLGK
ncbi:hypothetical protein LSH36_3619g00001 [Paralvinella palmiformis]|uniref:Fibrinogen C-terminal domain-containing protein n=1 Tax=Paralvinella palmiformis TaxID=53620 RepID=A0AAD9INY7_9ANNE|nr:hypothetical protein LSH36_3619g00001 [Paralvinella palmiformis]